VGLFDNERTKTIGEGKRREKREKKKKTKQNKTRDKEKKRKKGRNKRREKYGESAIEALSEYELAKSLAQFLKVDGFAEVGRESTVQTFLCNVGHDICAECHDGDSPFALLQMLILPVADGPCSRVSVPYRHEEIALTWTVQCKDSR